MRCVAHRGRERGERGEEEGGNLLDHENINVLRNGKALVCDVHHQGRLALAVWPDQAVALMGTSRCQAQHTRGAKHKTQALSARRPRLHYRLLTLCPAAY